MGAQRGYYMMLWKWSMDCVGRSQDVGNQPKREECVAVNWKDLEIFFFFQDSFIYIMYRSTLSLSSDTRGCWIPLQMVVSIHVVVGNWLRTSGRAVDALNLLSHLSSPELEILREFWHQTCRCKICGVCPAGFWSCLGPLCSLSSLLKWYFIFHGTVCWKYVMHLLTLIL